MSAGRRAGTEQQVQKLHSETSIWKFLHITKHSSTGITDRNCLSDLSQLNLLRQRLHIRNDKLHIMIQLVQYLTENKIRVNDDDKSIRIVTKEIAGIYCVIHNTHVNSEQNAGVFSAIAGRTATGVTVTKKT
jgi:hypothetical protein